jgi:hypothetical protein
LDHGPLSVPFTVAFVGVVKNACRFSAALRAGHFHGVHSAKYQSLYGGGAVRRRRGLLPRRPLTHRGDVALMDDAPPRGALTPAPEHATRCRCPVDPSRCSHPHGASRIRPRGNPASQSTYDGKGSVRIPGRQTLHIVGAQTHGTSRESTLAQHRIDDTVTFDFIAKRPKLCCWKSKNEDAARAKLYAPPVTAADVQRFFRDFRHEFGDDKFNIAQHNSTHGAIERTDVRLGMARARTSRSDRSQHSPVEVHGPTHIMIKRMTRHRFGAGRDMKSF